MMLYLRMIIVLGVSLYTSRVVLALLGVTDYGVYNVVAGVVMMLGVLSTSLAGASSRFLTIELGKGGHQLERVFRCSVSIHWLLSLFVLIIGETVGLWFVVNKLVIPSDRLIAACWIYQFALISIITKIVSAPYNALIISYEKMAVFAYISLFETIFQLLLILTLYLFPSNRLIFYGLFLAITQIIVRIIYQIYCNKKFQGIKSKWLWDKSLSMQMMKFASWTLIGSGAVMGYTQGINILLNLFFGPIANAARGLSGQIQAGVSQISYNLHLAMRPPIIKAYAQNNLTTMQELMVSHAKYSFFLVSLIVIPIIINTPYVLKLWLATVPEYTIDFTRLTLLGTLYCTLNGHTIIGVHATGDLKKFQIIEGGLLLLTLPIAYILLKYYHLSPNGVIIVYLIIEFLTQFVRVYLVYPMLNMNYCIYFRKILWPICLTLIPLVIFTLYGMEKYSATDFASLVGNTCISLVICTIFILFLGLNNKERSLIFSKIKNLF